MAKETDAWAAISGGRQFFSQAILGEARNYSISETHIFSPTMLNNFMFTLNRGIEGYPEAPAEDYGTVTIFEDGSLQVGGPTRSRPSMSSPFSTIRTTSYGPRAAIRSTSAGISPGVGQWHGGNKLRPQRRI